MTHLIKELAGEGTQRIQSFLTKIHLPNVLFGKKRSIVVLIKLKKAYSNVILRLIRSHTQAMSALLFLVVQKAIQVFTQEEIQQRTHYYFPHDSHSSRSLHVHFQVGNVDRELLGTRVQIGLEWMWSNEM